MSAERVLEYTHLAEDYPLEADMPPGAQKPPASWPQSGLIRFRNVVARYREGLPAALRNVTFTIHPGMTTGFAGQTGSGKSSVLMALCRTILVSSGQIYLDGLDISKIGIDTLKARIAVIPQVRITIAAVRAPFVPDLSWGTFGLCEILSIAQIFTPALRAQLSPRHSQLFCPLIQASLPPYRSP